MPVFTEAWSCVFCGKLYKRRAKYHCSKHEKYCKDNPDNRHACFKDCKHLKSGYEDIYSDYDGDPIGSSRTFTCKVTGKLMHSYIAERIGHPDAKCTDRMPLKCKHYEKTECIEL